MRWWITVLACCVCSTLIAQDVESVGEQAAEGAEEIEPVLPLQTVPISIREQSFFTDRVGTAVVYFDTVVEQPDELSVASETCNVIDIEVTETPNSETGQSAALLRFLPKQTGVVAVPSLEFRSERFAYQTVPAQIRVSEPVRSSDLSLSLKPDKLKVYVGEPLRVELAWECELNAGALRALRLYPDFFSDPAVEVVIPRNTDPEDSQVGLPVGGRRVVGKRIKNEADPKQLGRIELPLYLRFNESGTYRLPAARLDVAVVSKADSDFGRYAAHFNNGFFEAVDTTQAYERIYTTAAPIEIEVLPLPLEQQSANFSGLFAPLDVAVSLSSTEVMVGELMELEIQLSGAAPHGMLALPALSQQPGLRERFIVDDNYGRLWHEQGTRFRTRIRALSTSVQAFPSLHLQVFDPETGAFTSYRTEAIPLQVRATDDGQEFLSLKSFEGAAVSLTHKPEGIWHNLEAHPMNDLLNFIYSIVRQAFWPLLILGPIAFLLLLPRVRESRRRALDVRYRLRAEAYAEFSKLSGDSQAKWAAFLRFMALTFDAGDQSWTRSDSERALAKIGVDADDRDALAAMHEAADAQDFSQQSTQATFSNLDGLAKRISQLAAKATLLFLMLVVFTPSDAQANEWIEAEERFAEAQAADAGSDAATALYQDAALKFQAAASANLRPGESWYNSGNAWFQAGAIGRSIAAYRLAELYRPFDTKIADNLAAARAMTLNDVPSEHAWWQQVPSTWAKVILVLINLLFWVLLLFTLRYRHRRCVIASALCGLCLVTVSVYLLQKSFSATQAGTVVVDAVFGKKGPGYAYANAFNEPLHDGLEFTLVEQREDWGLIALPDTRQCWLPMSQVQLIVE